MKAKLQHCLWVAHTNTHTRAHTLTDNPPPLPQIKQAFTNSGIIRLANDLSTIQYNPSYEYPSFSWCGYCHPDEDLTSNSEFCIVLPASTQGGLIKHAIRTSEQTNSLSLELNLQSRWSVFFNQILEYIGLLHLWTDFPTLCYISKQKIHIKNTLVLFHF